MNQPIVVESGHIYTRQGLTVAGVLSVWVAKKVGEVLGGSEGGVQHCNFQDDVHETSPFDADEIPTDSPLYFLRDKMKYSRVIMESDTVVLAKEIIALLYEDKANLFKKCKDGSLSLSFKFPKNKGRWKRVLDEKGEPTCIAMDLACTIMKAYPFRPSSMSGSVGGIVNILGEGYRDQQKRVIHLRDLFHQNPQLISKLASKGSIGVGELPVLPPLMSILFSSLQTTHGYTVTITDILQGQAGVGGKEWAGVHDAIMENFKKHGEIFIPLQTTVGNLPI